MGSLYKGNTILEVANLKVGSTNISKLYYGSTQIFPPPPLPYSCILGDVIIGTQTWKGCNLNVDTYRNGDPIPQVTDPSEWNLLTTGAWCYFSNVSRNGEIYGKLYNWYAVNDIRGLGPTGYHVPTSAEFTTLSNYLGANSGGKMKQTGTDLWNDPNVGATNESGFTGIPGGYRNENSGFSSKNSFGPLWTSTSVSTDNATSHTLQNFNDSLSFGPANKKRGYYVRLIAD
jgi:uncharacterized protein (TIGR02145 family)